MADDELIGTWVGLVGGSPRTFVQVRISADGASVDIPAEGRFRVAAGLDGGSVLADVGGTSQRLTPGNGLERERALSAEGMRRICGTYVTADGSTAVVSSRGVGDETVPFVFGADGRGGFEAVRLHPIGPARLLSEEGEVVSVGAVDSGGRPTLTFDDGRPARTLKPVDLYDEEPFGWGSGELSFSGTLLLPRTERPTAAVVLMHGTQPGTRDFYRMFAHHFVMAGVAALVFDKRGFGETGGDADALLVDRANDAAEAVRALRRHPRIDAERIGLWAFSNGSWSAAMIAGGIEPVRFVVLVGPAGVSPAEAEIHRKLQELREWKVPDETLARVRRSWTLAYSCVVGTWSPEWDAEYDALIGELHADPQLAAVPLADYAVQQPWLAPVPPPFRAAQLREMAFGQMPEMGYDPCAALARAKAPVLFVIGEDDTNTPGREGAARVDEALRRAGNPDSKVVLIPHAAHFLNESMEISGMSAAEAAGELHCLRFVPGYFEMVTEWVVGRLAAEV